MAQQNDKPFDAGDAEQVNARQQKVAIREKRIDSGLALVLGHPDSRLWLFDLLEKAEPFGEPFTGNSTTFYNAGKQAWAKKLTATMLDHHLDAYSKMMKENNQ